MNETSRSLAAGTTLMLFALLAVASGGKKSGDASGDGGAASADGIKQRCNQIQALAECTEYPKGSSFTLAEAACGMLPDAGAVWGKDRCPTDKLVGKCVDGNKDALYENETTFYYAPDYTTDSAKKDCTEPAKEGKTFTAVAYTQAAASATPSAVMPPGASAPSGAAASAGSGSCGKATKCCKVLSGDASPSCATLANAPEQTCATSLTSFRKAVKATKPKRLAECD